MLSDVLATSFPYQGGDMRSILKAGAIVAVVVLAGAAVGTRSALPSRATLVNRAVW